MALPLDPVGNITLTLQIVILFLLILGLPLTRGKGEKKNLVRHGYLTALALTLHAVLIFVVMVPSFGANLEAVGKLSAVEMIIFWPHVILGGVAEVAGAFLVASWMFRSPPKMTCAKRKKWMRPIFVIWTVSLVTGALIHIIGII